MSALVWGALLVAAPAWRASDGANGASRLAAAIIDMLGARVCHQRPERSFFLAGQPMPVCGRCTGLYLSGAVGLLAAGRVSRRRGRMPQRARPGPGPAAIARWWPSTLDPRAAWLALAAVPTLTTWILEVGGAWNPGTPLRATAAIPLGAAAGWIVGRALRAS